MNFDIQTFSHLEYRLNIEIENPYIFCFFLGDNPNHRDFARKFKKETCLPIVYMQHLEEYIKIDNVFADKCINDASPADFINLIKNAEYVICDSFHASIFSIIFKKQFFTLNRYAMNTSNSRNTRIESLFSKLGLENRHIKGTELISDLLKVSTDYKSVHNIWREWKNESIDFLKNALGIV